MKEKNERYKKIKNLLRMQSEAMTVTDVYLALKSRMNIDVSRKTVERDLQDLTELKEVALKSENPSRFGFIKPQAYDIRLSEDEIKLILKLLKPDTELYLKLRRLL